MNPKDFTRFFILAKGQFLALALIATPALAQNGKWNVVPPQPYTRADFTRDCIAQAPAVPEYLRRAWVKSCSKDAP